MIRTLTLTRKVAGVTLLLFLGSIWPLAYFITSILQRDLGQMLAEQQLATVSAAAEDLDHKLDLRLDALRDEASGLPMDFLNSTFVGQHYLAHRRSLYSLFSSGVVLIGRDGSAVADYPPLPGRSQAGFKSQGYFRSVMETGRPAIGSPGLSPFSNTVEIPVAVPVRAPMGDLVGVLAGYVRIDDPSVFGTVMAKMGVSGGYRVVSPNDRLYVTATDPRLRMHALPQPGQDALHDRFMHEYEGSGITRNVKGVEELASARHLRNVDWYVEGVLPTHESFAPVDSMKVQIYTAAMLLSVYAAALMFWLMQHHLRPVEEASRLLRDMGAGKTPLHALPVEQHDEVGNLFAAFNALQEQIRQGELKLRENEEKFRVLFETSPVGIALNGEDGHFIDANEAILQMLGYSREEFAGLSYWDITGGYRADEDQKLMQLGDNVRYGPYEIEYLRKDGAPVPVLLSGMIVRGRGGRKLVWSLAQNLTEHVSAQRSMRLSAKVFEHSGEAILITDAENRIVSVNRAFCRITGYAPHEVVGHAPGILRSGRHDAEFYRDMWQAIQLEGQWQGEVWNRRKSGEVYPEWLTITTMKDEHGKVANYIGIFSDITDRKKSEESIRRLAQHDALTGLPNRLLLSDRLSQTLAAARRNETAFALMFIDLDRFKNINDSLGHNAGDQLLQEVARRLSTAVRASDTVSRQGGDEFVILAPEIEDAEAVAFLAGKLIEVVSMPYLVDNRSLTVTPSIGIALYPDDGEDVESLLRNADAAMYSAKNNGRNNFQFFTEDMNTRALEFLLMENSLRSALELGQLVLHYQPQVDATSGHLVGMEALVRWMHPERGLVEPGEFIPVAEESGLILPLGAWVLQEACRQAKAWQDGGLAGLPVAVNLSAIQFKRSDIVQTVRQALAESGLQPHYLELEVTESAIMQDADAVIDTLLNLKAMGVKLSVDDFGTGYSSLSYLKRFPIDKLKVDRSFVRDIAEDDDDARICCAVIGLAHSLGLSVIAEGVEHAAQLAFLRENHCNTIQGFYASRPLPAEQIAELLKTSQPLFEPVPPLAVRYMH